MTPQEHIAEAVAMIDRFDEPAKDGVPSMETRSVLVQAAQVHALIGIGQSLQEIRTALGQMKPIRI